jgi:AGCS family alanine or glycine:cation symporter
VGVGAVAKLSLVWNISDAMNGLMAIPNLIGLLFLTPVVVSETRKYFEKQKADESGELETSVAYESQD